jgi:ribosomal protein S18 acetylase RimI-like enzyme
VTFVEYKIDNLKLTDLPEAVKLHLVAFPDFFLSFLGPSFINLLYRFYITSDECLALACRSNKNNRLIGTIIGTTEPEGFYRRLAFKHFFYFGWASLKPLMRQPIIFKRLLRAFLYRGDYPESVAGGALLASICVNPTESGKSVGSILVKEFENRIWEKGVPFVYLITDLDRNEAVQKFYENLGLQIESEFTTPEGRNMRRYWIHNPHILPLQG